MEGEDLSAEVIFEPNGPDTKAPKKAYGIAFLAVVRICSFFSLVNPDCDERAPA